MRPGAILREYMSFARLRAPNDVRVKLKDVKSALEKEIATHAKRCDVHRLDRLAFEALELSKPLFYHAPRTGLEYEDDGWETINMWETYAYEPAVYSSFESLVEATDPIDRELTVRWGSVADGSVGNVSLDLLGGVNRQTAGEGFDRYHFNYRTGEYYNDEAYQPQQQADGWRAVLDGLGAIQHFQESTVGGIRVPVFASSTAARPADHGDYTVAELEIGGHHFFAGMHNDTLRGGQHFQANLSSKDFKSTREGLALIKKAMQAASQALGKPSDVTLDFSCLTEELEIHSGPLGQVGAAFPLVHCLIPYSQGFRPLARQALEAGEVRAYPLLILKRYKEDVAPISPMLAVNAVHTDDGIWIELQSSQRPDLIEQAAAILGAKPEFWYGAPEARWNWYPDHSWPGLPDTPCAGRSAGQTAPTRSTVLRQNIASAEADNNPASDKAATKKASAAKTGGVKKSGTKKTIAKKTGGKKSARYPKSAPKKKAADKKSTRPSKRTGE